MSKKEKVKAEIKSAVNMGNLMLTDLKKQGVLPKNFKTPYALQKGKSDKRAEAFLKQQIKRGQSEEDALKTLEKQTKNFKKVLNTNYTKTRKQKGLLPERNMPVSKKKDGGVEGGTAPIRLGLSKSQIGEMLSNAILRRDMKNPKRALTKVAEDEFIAGLDDLIQNPRARRNKYKGAIADGKSIYSEHGYSLRSKNMKTSKDKKARKKPEPRSGTIRNKTKKVKKLNMGGVMKNRGGTFKGIY